MDELQILYDSFSFLRKLTEEERAALAAVVRRRELRRRQFLLQAGDECRYYSFVVRGCLKMYHIDRQGREYGLLCAVESEWAMDLGSAHHRRPSSYFIEALEPTIVLQLAIEDLWQLWNRFHIFDRYFRVQTEEAYVQLQRALMLTYSASLRERYELFAAEYPQLIARLPALQIASFLGVTPEALSKVKRELLEAKRR